MSDLKDISNAVLDRFRHPILRTFWATWIAVHWRIPIVLIDDASASKRIEAVVAQVSWRSNALALLVTTSILVVLPFVGAGVAWVNAKATKCRLRWTKEARDGERLEIEERIGLVAKERREREAAAKVESEALKARSRELALRENEILANERQANENIQRLSEQIATKEKELESTDIELAYLTRVSNLLQVRGRATSEALHVVVNQLGAMSEHLPWLRESNAFMTIRAHMQPLTKRDSVPRAALEALNDAQRLLGDNPHRVVDSNSAQAQQRLAKAAQEMHDAANQVAKVDDIAAKLRKTASRPI